MTGALDRSAALLELQKKRIEDEQFQAVIQQRRQKLESLQQHIDELHRDQQKVKELHLSFSMFLKDEDADKAFQKAERERRQVLQKYEQIEELKEEKAELIERKHKLDRWVQRHAAHWDIMEQMVKMTTFKDVMLLADHLESQLHLRNQLCQRDREAQEQVDQQRKVMAALEDHREVLQLQKNNRLSQIQTDLEGMHSEALIWEKKWNHIQETAAKKTLLLGKVKMAILNLYEMTGGKLEGEEGVDMNDTEEQLEKVKLFIQDIGDIVENRHIPSQRHSDGQRRASGKRHITTHFKKH